MLRFPKIVVDRFQNGACKTYKIDPEFEQDSLISILNGKNSIESVYGLFLSQGIELGTINNLFQILTENQLVEDRIGFESSVFSEQELENFSRQIETLSWFNRQYEENQFDNLVVGLKSQEKLHETKIEICGNTPLAQEVTEKSRKAGITTISTKGTRNGSVVDAGLFIYLPEKFDEQELIALLKYCDENKIPFLSGIPTNYGIEFGPFYVPDDAACPLCLINRRKSVLGEGYNQGMENQLQFNFPIGADQIVLEVIRFITGITPLTLRNKVLQFNIVSGLSVYHPVLKIPGCEVCGLGPNQPKRKLWEGIV